MPAQGRRSGKPQLTLPELDTRFHEFLLDTYHRASMAIRKCRHKSAGKRGGFLPQMPESLEQLDLLLLTVAKSRHSPSRWHLVSGDALHRSHSGGLCRRGRDRCAMIRATSQKCASSTRTVFCVGPFVRNWPGRQSPCARSSAPVITAARNCDRPFKIVSAQWTLCWSCADGRHATGRYATGNAKNRTRSSHGSSATSMSKSR